MRHGTSQEYHGDSDDGLFADIDPEHSVKTDRMSLGSSGSYKSYEQGSEDIGDLNSALLDIAEPPWVKEKSQLNAATWAPEFFQPSKLHPAVLHQPPEQQQPPVPRELLELEQASTLHQPPEQQQPLVPGELPDLDQSSTLHPRPESHQLSALHKLPKLDQPSAPQPLTEHHLSSLMLQLPELHQLSEQNQPLVQHQLLTLPKPASARELRQSPTNKLVALVMLHRILEAKLACAIYSRPSAQHGYNMDVIYVPPHTGYVGEFESVATSGERYQSLLEGRIPDVILVEGNYSYPGCQVCNVALIEQLLEQFPKARLVVQSTTQCVLDQATAKFSAKVDDFATVNNCKTSSSSDVFVSPREEEKELILRAKQQGRRATMSW